MPIGIPKVPTDWWSSKEKKKDWVYVNYPLIIHSKILFLCREITGVWIDQVIGLLLYLSQQDDRDISLYIHSPGGSALSSIALYDVIKHVQGRVDVRTIGMGLAASGASLILVGGTKTKRFALPHARIMIHQPRTAPFIGTPREIELEAEELFRLREVIADMYSQNTGRPINEIQNDMERDTYMSATEAQAYGIVDRIIRKKQKEENKRRS